MAKESGIGDRLFVDGLDISGDVGAVERIGSSAGELDVTSILKGGHERIYGLSDGELSFQSWFNDADGESFDELKDKNSGVDRVVCYFHGAAIGNMAAGLVGKQNTFDWDRGADGSLSGSAQCMANGFGLEYCEQLTAGKRTDTEATNGDELDGGAASSLGLAAYLHVFAFTGTDATVKIQSSSDDGGTDAYADVTGGGFTQITDAPFSQRIVTGLTAAIEQYLRAVTVTSAGFTNLEFAVCVTRNPVDD